MQGALSGVPAKSFTYDAKGNLTSVTDQNGNTTTFTYDKLDRLLTKAVPSNGSVPGGTISYQYDAAGNLTNVQHYNGSKIAMTYDALNRMTQSVQTLPNGRSFTIGYSYDADGNRTAMSTPWGNFAYTYDALNRETSVTNPQGEAFRFGYDANGRRVSLSYPNGVQTSYGYDAAGQLLQLVHQKNGTALAFMNYAYDGDGNRTSMTTQDGTHSYGYDNLNRLTSASHPAATSLPILSESFAYDAVGNRLSDAQITGYAYNAANELTSNSSFTYVYDNNGNQTQVKSILTGAATNYSYDAQNELVAASLPSGSASYQYDALGRRVEKSTGTPTYFLYDGMEILATVDGMGNPLALFTRGSGIAEPLEIHHADGTEYFIHADGLNSVIALTDNTGAVVERIAYEAYGQPIFLDVRGAPTIEAQPFTGDPFAIAGAFYDVETGLYYLSERQTYDPITGRFGQPDPMGMDAGVNIYLYAKADPVLFTDPYGLLTCTYEIGKHRLHCVNNAGKPFTTTNVKSGNGSCENTPSGGCTSAEDVGPIPPGGYRIFPPGENPDYPHWLWLRPRPGVTKRPGRFYIHPGTFSMGCITLNPALFPELEEWSIEDNGGLLNVLP